jgi:hypothetical protein
VGFYVLWAGRDLAGSVDLMPRRLMNEEIRKLADDFAILLGRIQNDELVASAAMTYRIEGALTALRAVLGESSSLFADLGALGADPEESGVTT